MRGLPALVLLSPVCRPVREVNTPSRNTVPVSIINSIARFLITRDALLSALSVCPQFPQTNAACVLRLSGVSVSTFGALLRGIRGWYTKTGFAVCIRFVLRVRLYAMPANIEDRLVESGFLLRTVRQIEPVFVLFRLWLARHAAGFQGFENEYLARIDDLAAGLVRKVITNIRLFSILSCYAYFGAVTAVTAFLLASQTALEALDIALRPLHALRLAGEIIELSKARVNGDSDAPINADGVCFQPGAICAL